MATGIQTGAWEQSGSVVDSLVVQIAEKLGAVVKASTVFGEPVERDGVTVIPIAKARWGFGAGGGTGQDEHRPGGGSGGGGGMPINPVGYIEIGHGQSTFRPIRDRRRYLPAALGMTALLLISLKLLDLRSRRGRTAWAGFRR
jgi:uncharacterized spore protein YtfJ